MLKSALITTLVLQLALAPFAMADGVKSDDPSSSPFWKVAPVNKSTTGGDCDPFGVCNEPGGSPGWPNSGPTGGWDDPGTGLGGTWNTPQLGFGSISQLEDPTVYGIKTMDILSRTYEKNTLTLVRNNPGKSVDEIADVLIKGGTKSAVNWAIFSSAVFFVINYTVTRLSSNSGGAVAWVATAIPTALAAGYEFSQIFKAQANMVLSLDALYGGIADNPEGRLERIANIFAGEALWAGTQNLAVKEASQLMVKKLSAVAGILAAQPGALTPPLAQAAVAAGQAAQQPVFNAAVAGALGQVANKQTGTVGIPDETTGTVVNQSKGKIIQGLANLYAKMDPDLQKFAVGAVTCFAAALVSIGVNYFATEWLAKDWIDKFKEEAADRQALGLSSLNENSEAKHALWLILTRDVFNRIVPSKEKSVMEMVKVTKEVNGQIVTTEEPRYTKLVGVYKPNYSVAEMQRYADVVAKMLPLFESPTFGSEFEELTKEFKDNPKIIDKYLLHLRSDLTVEGKIWFMKILLAGMYVKGRLNDGDIDTIHTVATYLMLEPPPGKEPAANDVRNLQIAQYKLMFAQMAKAITAKQTALAGLNSKKSLSDADKQILSDLRERGTAGQALYEDFLDTGAALVRLGQRAVHKGSTDKEIANALNAALEEQTMKSLGRWQQRQTRWQQIKSAVGIH